ncbi:MAG: DNA mismatch repair protein MutS [Candidatus Azobacteroides sp.]|nr:DNA mismatch repair protein MutS [Candidatus Azobacteroides sp.]
MLHDYYRNNISLYSQELSTVGNRIWLVGTCRLLVVASALFFAWIFRDESRIAIAFILVGHFIVFAVLLKTTGRLNRKKDYTRQMLKINTDELNGLNYDFSAFDGFPERIDPQHPFTFDLDIFGDQSVFQSINRTKTAFGKQRLADWFENPLVDRSDILQRQTACRELSHTPEFCRHFAATAMLSPGNLSDLENLKKFVAGDNLISKPGLWKLISFLLPAGWLLIFILFGTGLIDFSSVVLSFFAAVGISYCRIKKINRLQDLIGNKVTVLSTYSSLLKIVEEQPVASDLLKLKQRQLFNGTTSSSVEIKKLSEYLNALELRKTFPAGILLNIFFLWEIKYAVKIEAWKNHYRNDIEKLFDTLATVDALCSLGTFAFNHPEFPDPEISDRYFEFRAENMGHLLLRDEVCVKNEVEIPHAPYFLIVTGANMAGKSTYLRTVGLNFLLGCIGAPVYASSMRFCPARMVTGLRTADSLVTGKSYFFAELKRLSGMIEMLQNGGKLFIILDEMLKGTNSLDKQKGSSALIKQFIALNSCGIIATHDLVLGELAGQYPQYIRNYCFEADIQDDEIRFSYRLRPGIAQNMNACFLMNKMGIAVDE